MNAEEEIKIAHEGTRRNTKKRDGELFRFFVSLRVPSWAIILSYLRPSASICGSTSGARLRGHPRRDQVFRFFGGRHTLLSNERITPGREWCAVGDRPALPGPPGQGARRVRPRAGARRLAAD